MKRALSKVLYKFVTWLNKDSPREIDDEFAKVSTNMTSPISKSGNNRADLGNNGFNFTIYNADGGKIVQMSHYNNKTDKYTNNLYVLPDGENLGDEIGMIISRESLSR